jgi:hypothetical protein
MSFFLQAFLLISKNILTNAVGELDRYTKATHIYIFFFQKKKQSKELFIFFHKSKTLFLRVKKEKER